MAERAVVVNKTLLFLYCVIRSLNLSERTGERSSMARAYATTGFALGLVGLHRLAKYYLHKANECIKGESSLKSRELVLRYSGYYYGTIGEFSRAEKSWLLAANHAGEIGQAFNQETNWTGLLFIALNLGNFERALYFAKRIRDSASQRGDAGFEAAANYWEATIKIEQNNFMAAIALLEEAAAAPREVMNLLDWIIVHSGFAQAYLRQGQIEAALEEAEQVMNFFSQVQRPSNALYFYGYTSQAVIYLSLWEEQPSGVSLQQMKESARQACWLLDEFAGIIPFSKPRALLYRGLYDWLEGNTETAHRNWHRGLESGEKFDSPFDQGLVHYEIGRHLSPGEVSKRGWTATQHLRCSHEILSRLGAEYFSKQVGNAMKVANIS
jgi:hypothetical protein